jgi:hypothetical protein
MTKERFTREQITNYGSTNAESIRTFLNIWPTLEANFQESWNELIDKKNSIFTDNSYGFSWCQLYELPIKAHFELSLKGFIDEPSFHSIFQDFITSKDQISAIPQNIKQIETYFENLETLSKEDSQAIMPIIGAYYGVNISVFNSVQCLLYHGVYLNELIARVSYGDDKALFNSIRIDPTVLGCKSVILRVAKAAFLKDEGFFKKLKAAINRKKSKREQSHYQKMRLILQILHEAGAGRLNDAQLYDLFVRQLNLYFWDAKEGGNAKALRKFADTYMRKEATT